MAGRWTPEEDAYLLAQCAKSDTAFLSRVLKRSPDAVRRRVKVLTQRELENPLEMEWFLSRANRTTPKRDRKVAPEIHERNAATSKFGRGNAYQHTKTGFRPDLGIVLRSGWEANVCRVLASFDIDFEFEPRIFPFPVKRGNKAYTPDIYLTHTAEWIEVKGYFDKASQTKMKRFRKYYPEDFASLTMITSRSNVEICRDIGVPTVLVYDQIKKLFKPKIVNWEGK